MSNGSSGGGSMSFRITNPTSSSSSRPQAAASSSSQHRNVQRPQYNHQRYDSESEEDDEDDGAAFKRRKARDEAIVAIDNKGIRSSSAPKKEKALVIPSQPNKDFRRAALELRAKKAGRQQFIPGQLSGMSGAGEGKKRVLTEAEQQFLESESNVQRIGDKLAVGGIRIRQTAASLNDTSATGDVDMLDDGDKTPVPGANEFAKMVDLEAEAEVKVDADALALRELLAEQDIEEEEYKAKVHIIPQAPNVTEEEAYALDVASRPDTPDLEAYQRVPIEDFGAALLRGMGGGNKPRPKVEAYVPKQRTALLGIGAKSREETFGKDWVAQQDGVKKGANKQQQMRFMPLQRVEKPSSSGSASPAPLPIEASRAESSSSRRRREEKDYSDEEDKRHRKQRRRSRDNEDDSEAEERRRRKRRERSRSPRNEEAAGKRNDKHKRDRDSDDKPRYDDRDRTSSKRDGSDRSYKDSSREKERERERDRDRDRRRGRDGDGRDSGRDRKYRDDEDRDRRR